MSTEFETIARAEAHRAQAAMARLQYDAFMDAGFTDEQAWQVAFSAIDRTFLAADLAMRFGQMLMEIAKGIGIGIELAKSGTEIDEAIAEAIRRRNEDE